MLYQLGDIVEWHDGHQKRGRVIDGILNGPQCRVEFVKMNGHWVKLDIKPTCNLSVLCGFFKVEKVLD